MGYALFWVESLAAALFLTALVTAVSAHQPRRWNPWVGGAFLLLLLLATASTIASVVIRPEFGFLSVALILMALVTWGMARSTRGLFRWYFPCLAFLLILASACAIAGMTTLFSFGTHLVYIQESWFWYVLCWTILFACAGAVIIVCGLRNKTETAKPVGYDWPRTRLALACAGAVALAGITLSNMDMALRMQLATERVETGARLLSLRPAPVSDRDNAALIYQKAFEVMLAPEKMKPAWKGIYDDSFNPQNPDLRKFLDSQAAALDLLRQAARKPGCVFDHDYSEGYEMRIPEVQSLRNGCSLLAADAVSKAAQGDNQTALADVNAIFGISSHLKSQPFFVGLLVAIAAESDGARAFEKVLELLASPPRKGIKPLNLAELSFPPGPTFSQLLPRCLQMEEIAGIGIFLDMSYFRKRGESSVFYNELGAAGSWFLSSIIYRVFLLPDDLVAYRKELKTLRHTLDLPYQESIATMDNCHRYEGVMTRLLLPACQRVRTAAAQGDAVDKLVQLAKASVLYREAKGKYPEKLDDLVPVYLAQVSIDPFDGKPLRMKKTDKGLVLYSVGPNLKDDGGTRAENNTMEGDIVFRLP